MACPRKKLLSFFYVHLETNEVNLKLCYTTTSSHLIGDEDVVGCDTWHSVHDRIFLPIAKSTPHLEECEYVDAAVSIAESDQAARSLAEDVHAKGNSFQTHDLPRSAHI